MQKFPGAEAKQSKLDLLIAKIDSLAASNEAISKRLSSFEEAMAEESGYSSMETEPEDDEEEEKQPKKKVRRKTH